MNKIQKVALSILGGIDVTFYIFTPILVISILIGIIEDLTLWKMYSLYFLGICATFFRAIKIGWFKNE